MTNYVTADQLKAMLSDGGELALLDVREEGAHSQSHLFYAAPMPLSVLELLAEPLVPRRGTRVVLVDAGGGLADRAAAKLADLGYTGVACLQGGIAAWEAAGYMLFSGVHVPCKAFGEYVEHHYGTPHIKAEALQAMRDAGDDLVILDSRPMDEFHLMNIPDGIDCPGAELAYRVHDMAPDPNTTVVVNCAGRTRSIIGAQSLINAAIPNPVDGAGKRHHGLASGGLQVGTGAKPHGATALHRRSGQGPDKCRGRRQTIPSAHHRPRHPGAMAGRGGAADSVHSRCTRPQRICRRPSGRRGQCPRRAVGAGIEEWCATLGARVVLVDDTGVRATMTASWLVQMGWDVAVLDSGLDGFEMTTEIPRRGPAELGRPERMRFRPANWRSGSPADDVLVVDLAPSRDFDKGHVPGAWWAVRARLADSLPKLGKKSLLVPDLSGRHRSPFGRARGLGN